MVSSELYQVLKRLALSQPTTPIRVRGGLIASTDAVCKCSLFIGCLSFHEFHFLVVPVHEGRGRQAENEINRHDERHTLDRLARLVDGGS